MAFWPQAFKIGSQHRKVLLHGSGSLKWRLNFEKNVPICSENILNKKFVHGYLVRSLLDGELPGANVTPPHYSLEPIFLGPLEVVIWEIDG